MKSIEPRDIASGGERAVVAACGIAACLLGIAGLVGWALGSPVLTRVAPAYKAIAPSVAICLIVLGLALPRLVARIGRGERLALAVVAALVSLVGLLELIGLAAGVDLNLEDALTARLARASSIPFETMSPVAGGLLFLVGAAMLALLLGPRADRRRRGLGDAAGALGVVAAVTALVLVLGYAYGAPLLYGGPAIPIAATAALGALLLAVGTVAAAGHEHWPLQSVAGDSTRARLLRAFVPLTVLGALAVSVAEHRMSDASDIGHVLVGAVAAVVLASVAGLAALRIAQHIGETIDRARLARQQAEDALRDSQADLNRAQAVAHTGSWRLNVRRNELLWSDETYSVFGIPQGTPMTYEAFLAAVYPDDREYVDRSWQAALSGEAYDIEHRIVVGDTVRWVREKAELEFDKDGTVLGGFGTVQDITERKQAEEALRRSEERYRGLFETMQEGFALHEIICDASGTPIDYRFLDVNPAFERLTGLTREQVLGKTVREVLPGTEAYWIEIYGRVALTGESARIERYAQPLGRFYEAIAYSPRPGQFAAIFSDVTARKRAEHERDRQARLLEAIVENTDAHLVYLDRDFNFIWVNSAYARAGRRGKEEFVGHNHFEFYPHAENEAIFRRVRDTGESARYVEKPFEFPDMPERGVTYWDWTLTPLRNEEGEVENLIFSLADVTDKVRAREQLLEAERSRAQLAETLNAEINHRMKNNLTLLSGLLQMQISGRPRDDLLAQQLRQTITRIASLSVIHEHLYEGRAGQVELKDSLVRIGRMAADALAQNGVELTVTGDTIYVPPKLGSTIAILANEFITNAIKHGGPDARGSTRVEVELTRRSGAVRLRVWNSGKALPADFDALAVNGMGLELVRSVVTSQLGGTFSLSSQAGGVAAEIAFPDSVLEAAEPAL